MRRPRRRAPRASAACNGCRPIWCIRSGVYRQRLSDVLTANTELRASNQEQEVLNEELRVSNEELAASEGELHALNAELASRVDDLARANSDMRSVIESTQIAIVFLDQALRIRSFTPAVQGVMPLRDSDLRPLHHRSCIADRLFNVAGRCAPGSRHPRDDRAAGKPSPYRGVLSHPAVAVSRCRRAGRRRRRHVFPTSAWPTTPSKRCVSVRSISAEWPEPCRRCCSSPRRAVRGITSNPPFYGPHGAARRRSFGGGLACRAASGGPPHPTARCGVKPKRLRRRWSMKPGSAGPMAAGAGF